MFGDEGESHICEVSPIRKKPKAIMVDFKIWPGKRQQIAIAATGAPSDP